MPKGSAKGSKQRTTQRSASTKSDFTLYDFAHAAVAPDKISSLTGRVKKADMNGWCAEVKQLVQHIGGQSTSSSVGGEAAWYDRDLADYDSVEEEEPVDEGEEPGNEGGLERIRPINRPSTRQRKLTCSEVSDNNGSGHVYPIDIWFMIGQFVLPEDVSTFASICRSSREVTHSAQFWQKLYRRFYSPQTVLPVTLSPATIDRVHGLKGRVIRALHFLYPPYIERVRSPVQLDSFERIDRLVNLQGLTCVRQWYVKVKQQWTFYWTFCRSTRLTYGSEPRRSAVDALRATPDVTLNKETGSVVLQAVSPSFVHLPQVTGLVLVNLTTSGGTYGGGVHGCSRGHKLRLVFDARYVRKGGPVSLGSGGGVSGTVVIVDPVLQVDVLHWYHPAYPGNND